MGTVGVLLGNGDGTLQPAVNHSSGGQITWSGTIADVDGDGTFQPPVTYDSGGIAVVVGDVNGDGRPDPLAVNYNSGTLKPVVGGLVRPPGGVPFPIPLVTDFLLCQDCVVGIPMDTGVDGSGHGVLRLRRSNRWAQFGLLRSG